METTAGTKLAAWDANDGSVPEQAAETESSSLIASLKQRRARAAGERYFDVDVPGYASCLVIRCGPLSGAEAQKLQDRANLPKVSAFASNADVLITACREVLGRQTVEEELEPLDPEHGPTRIDYHLAELFGIEPDPKHPARSVLLALFEGANAPELAISATAQEYSTWAQTASEEVDAEFVGESPAARK